MVYNSKLSLGLSDQASQLPWYLSPLSFETSCMDQVSVRIVTRHTKIRSIYIQLPYILNHHCPSSSMSSSSSTSSSPSSHHLHQSISNINILPWSQMKKYLVLSIINHQLYSILTIFAPTRDPGLWTPAWMVKKPTFPISCEVQKNPQLGPFYGLDLRKLGIRSAYFTNEGGWYWTFFLVKYVKYG